MKRLLLPLLLPVVLAACGSASPSLNGGRPDLPTGAEVRHPGVPGGATVYLNLLSDAGESYYQTSAVAGSTSTTVDPTAWRGKESGKTAALPTLVPADATVSDPGAQVLLLHWVMWQDSNSDGVRQPTEQLALMSHDRVAYVSKAVTISFKTATPDMQQRWTLASGWSRAAHFVYLPSGSSTYQRTLTSTTLERYELHVPTPVTSQ
ncbi:hypothetical protein [Deinococcus sonorensis]|uniref:Lipoprotein n=2 Tax=Deinococcus sonorensis TaxID=309891 RepID=A0AAU7UE90_9DEIO